MAWINFAICLFLGFLGVHKFKEKKIGMGILYLLTFGLFGLGWLWDCVKYLIIAIKSQKKGKGITIGIIVALLLFAIIIPTGTDTGDASTETTAAMETEESTAATENVFATDATTEPATEPSTEATAEPSTTATTEPEREEVPAEEPTQSISTKSTEPPTGATDPVSASTEAPVPPATTGPTETYEPPTEATEPTAAPTEEPEPPTEAPAPPTEEPEPPTEAPEPPTTEAEPEQYTYVLNYNTGKFHHAWCSSADKIAPENKGYHTGTRDEVIAMGFVPCKNCNP